LRLLPAWRVAFFAEKGPFSLFTGLVFVAVLFCFCCAVDGGVAYNDSHGCVVFFFCFLFFFEHLGLQLTKRATTKRLCSV
jgi:hypothetical protein